MPPACSEATTAPELTPTMTSTSPAPSAGEFTAAWGPWIVGATVVLPAALAKGVTLHMERHLQEGHVGELVGDPLRMGQAIARRLTA